MTGIPAFYHPPTAGKPWYLAHVCGIRGRTNYAEYHPSWELFRCHVCDETFDPAHIELPLCIDCGGGMSWQSKAVAVCDRNPSHLIDLARRS